MCVRVWFCASKAKNSLGKDEGGGRVPPKSMLTLMYFLTKCSVTISLAMLSILNSHFLTAISKPQEGRLNTHNYQAKRSTLRNGLECVQKKYEIFDRMLIFL